MELFAVISGVPISFFCSPLLLCTDTVVISEAGGAQNHGLDGARLKQDRKIVQHTPFGVLCPLLLMINSLNLSQNVCCSCNNS